MIQSEFLAEAKERLAEAFGERFRGLVLHGSEARGDAGPESDIDLLVLLEGPIELWDDIGTAVEALYPMQLETDRAIESIPVDVRKYEGGATPFLQTVQESGVRV